MRKLADSKKARGATEAEKEYIRSVLNGLNIKVDFDNLTLYDPVETPEAPFGYSGRMVLMEQLVVNDSIQAFIRGETADIDTAAIEKTAKNQGMLTLEQKGVLAAMKGETTLAEVSRVI